MRGYGVKKGGRGRATDIQGYKNRYKCESHNTLPTAALN